MKRVWGWFIIIGASLVFAACGTTKVDSIHPVVRSADLGKDRKIVILPFSDYTPSESPMGYWRRNMVIMEALQDEILRYGYLPAISENVISYLSQKKVIRKKEAVSQSFSAADTVLRAELAKEWSDTMKAELARALASNMKKKRWDADQESAETYKSIAIDHQMIQEIGRTFDADYVIRGRIMVFKNGLEDSFNPLQTGVLPFFFNTGSRTLFGLAESDKYEMIDKMAIGGLVGAVLAPSNSPLDGSTSTQLASGHPRFGGGLVQKVESYSGWNAAIWGGAGAGLAHLAHKGGRVENAVVQLRMIVQDTHTGGILWTNRAEVKAMPESAFNKKDGETLISQAVQQVCQRLFDSFVATENNRRVVRRYDDGTFYVTPVGGLKAMSDQCDPYHPIHVDSPGQVAKKRSQFPPLSSEKNPKKQPISER